MRPSPPLLAVLLLLAGSAIAAEAVPVGPLAALPTALEVELGGDKVLELAPSITFILSDDRFVQAVRVKEGLKLHATYLGGALLFLADGEETHSITISVVVAPPRQLEGSKRPVRPGQEADDLPLRLLTGGWLTRGTFGLNASGTSERGFDTRFLSTSLEGKTDALTYSLNGYSIQRDGTPGTFDGTGFAYGRWGRASFGGAAQQTEFKPLLFGRSYREAAGQLVSESLVLDAGVRAPYFYDRPSFLADAVHGFVQAKFGLGFAGAGLIAGGLDKGAKTWLPLLGTGVGSGTLGASVYAGATSNGSKLLTAEGHASGGPCLVQGRYSTGLRGPAAGADALALQAYVDPTLDSFFGRGQCRVGGGWSLGLGALRGGTVTPLIDPRAVMLSGTASWSGPSGQFFAAGQWSTSGRDLRDTASAGGQLNLGKYVLSALANASRPLDTWSFNENVTLRRMFSGGSVGVTGGTTHDLGAPKLGWAALDGQLESNELRASVSLQGGFSTYAPPEWNGVFDLAWIPFPAYTLRAYSFLDLRHYQHWNLSLGFTYAFGDLLPREPLLAPLRKHSVEAFAFEDLDGDGKQGPGEPGLAGVRVCLDRDCGVTDATGRWTVEGVSDGRHKLTADAGALEGARPTTDVEETPAVGSFQRQRVTFGFRRSGEVVVRAFLDANGNGRRDPGEEEFEKGGAQITGPGLDTTVTLGRKARATFTTLGDYRVRLDMMALPAGFAAPPEDVRVRADAFHSFAAEVPVRAMRAIAGTVCLDRDGDGACGPGELVLGGLRVHDGAGEALTDTGGNYLLRELAPGLHAVHLDEADLPPGTSLARPPVVTLPVTPGVAHGVIVALSLDPAAARSHPVPVRWPDGTTRQALEVGGYTFAAGGLGGGAAPGEEDARILRQLTRRAKKSGLQLAVRVYSGNPDNGALPAPALARAQATADALVKWLRPKLPAGQVSTEARPAARQEQVVEVRLYGLPK